MIPHIHSVMSFDFGTATQKLRDVKEFVAEVVATCALLANVLPRYERIASDKLRWAYRWLVVAPIAAVGLNFRKHLPSLNINLFGWFKKSEDCPHCGSAPEPKPNDTH